MPTCLPGDHPARWRALDSQAWALVTMVCTLYLPQVGRTCLGELSLLYMGPVAWATLSVLALGEPSGLARTWQLWRLRAAWICFAGLAPFLSWWLRCVNLPYLAVAALLAMLSACWAFLETCAMVGHLARSRGLPGLALDALLARIALLYFLVIPLLALWVTFAAALLAGWATVPGDWLRLWRQVPPWGRLLLTYAPVVALMNLARLLLRATSGLSALPCAVTVEPPGGPDHDAAVIASPPDCRP